MTEIGAVDRTQLPTDIRSASTADQQKYAAAQQFEQMLAQKMLSQMSSLMSDSSSDDDSGDDEDSSGSSSDAVSAHYREMLPQLMAKSMTAGDGLGIARDLYNSMKAGS